jgi:histidyl-tRNA synthetase
MVDNTARIPAGMRDILPQKMIQRQYVMDVLREVFESFGYEPIQTSAIEMSETLTGKYGEDAERLIYKAWYGDEPDAYDEYALRYDLTVPLCRFIAMYPDVPRPFKRYHIAPVWRADRPQKGRYREFYQCDVDVVGSASMMVDAEVIQIIHTVLKRLGFHNFTVHLNSRRLLKGIGQYAGVPDSLLPDLFRAIDKLDKIGMEGVRRELLMVGIPQETQRKLERVTRRMLQGKTKTEDAFGYMKQLGLPDELAEAVNPRLPEVVEAKAAEDVPSHRLQEASVEMTGELAPVLRAYYADRVDLISDPVVDRMLNLIAIQGDNRKILDDLTALVSDYPEAMAGISELSEILDYTEAAGIDTVQVDFSMVRGLEYYTGPIHETTIEEPKMPSITGGGRYDELIGMFMDHSYPTSGMSFGMERIIDAMDELGMYPDDLRITTAEVLVTTFSAETAGPTLKLANQLRGAGLNVMQYFEYEDRLGDQIGYAASKGIPYVVILGPDEIEAGEATVIALGKTRKDREQKTVKQGEIVDLIEKWESEG